MAMKRAGKELSQPQISRYMPCGKTQRKSELIWKSKWERTPIAVYVNLCGVVAQREAGISYEKLVT